MQRIIVTILRQWQQRRNVEGLSTLLSVSCRCCMSCTPDAGGKQGGRAVGTAVGIRRVHTNNGKNDTVYAVSAHN